MIDNIRHIKKLFLCIQLAMAFWFLIMGYASYSDYTSIVEHQGTVSVWSIILLPANYFFVACI